MTNVNTFKWQSFHKYSYITVTQRKASITNVTISVLHAHMQLFNYTTAHTNHVTECASLSWAPETFKKKHNTIQASWQDLAKKVPVKHKLLKFQRKRVASSLSKDQNNKKQFYSKIKVWFLRIIWGFWATKWLKTHLDNKNKKQQSLRAFFFFKIRGLKFFIYPHKNFSRALGSLTSGHSDDHLKSRWTRQSSPCKIAALSSSFFF